MTYYWFDASGYYGSTKTTLIANDADLSKIRVQNNSATDVIAVAFGDRDPAVYGAGSWTLGPGAALSEDDIELGKISIISAGTDTPVTCTFATLSDVNPNATAASAEFVTKLTGTYTSTQETAVRTLYEALYNARILTALAGGGVYVGAMANAADSYLNWTGGSALTAVVAPSFSAFQGWGFGGSQALDTGILMSSAASLNDHSMFVWAADQTVEGSAALAMGDTTIRIGPNRTATTSTFYDTTSAAQVVGIGGSTGLIGLCRYGSPGFTSFLNGDTEVDVTLTSNTLSSFSIYVGAIHGSSGLAEGYTESLRAALFGRSLSSDQIAMLHDALQAYFTVVGS